MERNIQKIGLVNWLVLLITTVLAFFAARYSNSAAGIMGTVYLGIGFLIAFLSYFQMRLLERENLEKLEMQELKRTRGDSTLFAEASSDTFPAMRARAQFDRYFVPFFTFILLVIQVYAVFRAWEAFRDVDPPRPDQARISMALFGLFALILYLIGKYSAGLARLEKQALLRPGAAYLMLGAFICFFVAVSQSAVLFQLPWVDVVLGRVLCVILGIVALETLFSLVFEVYRPRVQGQASRMLYESRLIGLLGQPEGIITTAAQALDYQFGFKVSETWFYRFLERAFAWIILIQLALLLLSTSFVMIEPDEQGMLERFGKPIASGPVLEPGLHLKMPWPIDRVYRYPTRQIQQFNVGFGSAEGEDDGHGHGHGQGHDDERVLVWTKAHHAEEVLFLVASREQQAQRSLGDSDQAIPVNFLSVSIPVHFQIADIRKWAYLNRNPAELLEKLATREVIRYLVSVDLADVMANKRSESARILRDRIQAQAKSKDLGVDILFVGLQDIHPPVSVAEAYELVIGAEQDKEATILAAEGYKLETVPRARAEADRLISEAKSYAARRVADAAAEAGQFTNRLFAYEASPRVFSQRTYLEQLSTAVAPTRKYVIGTTNVNDIIYLNLEDKLRPDLMDVTVDSN